MPGSDLTGIIGDHSLRDVGSEFRDRAITAPDGVVP